MSTGTTALKQAVVGPSKDEIALMKPKDQVKHLLEVNKQVIAQALPKHMNPERLMRVAITSVTGVPALLECYVPTLIGGIIQCSQMGLEPNTVLGHAYLVPFWNSKKNRKDAQVIVGYKGLIDLARRSGQIVSIAAHAVYENDEFEFEYGLNEKLKHVPADGDRGSIKRFYAVAHMKDGGHAFEVMSAAAVRLIRDAAAAKNNAKRDSEGQLIIKGPWSDHFEEMGRKTVIRRLSKYLPLSVELATAVSMGDTQERGEAQNLESVLDGEYTVAQDVDEMDGDADGDQAGATPIKEAAAKRKAKSAPAEPKGDPTDKQEAELDGIGKQTAGGAFSVAQIGDMIQKATTLEALAAARDLIRSVPEQFREQLDADAAAKLAELTK